MKKLLIINGPNLNLLGSREPEIYGKETLQSIEEYTKNKLNSLGFNLSLEWLQSNSEGEILEALQAAKQKGFEGLIINPAAYSHTSVAILDCLRAKELPLIEVHLSNVHTREEYRAHLTAKGADGVIEGLGKDVYFLAALALSK